MQIPGCRANFSRSSTALDPAENTGRARCIALINSGPERGIPLYILRIMKISDLITRLEDLKHRRGDLDVQVRNPAGDFDSVEGARHSPIGRASEVAIIDTDDGGPTEQFLH